MQVRLKFRHREPRDLANLLVTALMKNLERKDESLVIVESGQRLSYQLVQFLVQKLTYRQRPSIAQTLDRLVVKVDSSVVLRAGSQRLARHVLGNPEQPCRKLRVLPEGVKPFKRSDKCFLGKLFG